MNREDRQRDRLTAQVTEEIAKRIADDPFHAWWLYQKYGQQAVQQLSPSARDHDVLVELAALFPVDTLRTALEEVTELIETHRNIAASFAAEAKELRSQIAALEQTSEE